MTIDYSILIFILGTSVMLLFVFFIVIFLIIHKKKRYEHLLEKQQMENSYQNQLLLSRIEVQEQAFKYFSEEIHDNIGQVLSIAKMQLHGIRSCSTEPEVVKRAADSIELVGKAITDLRNISHTFNTAFVASAGLADAIEKDLEYVRSAKNVQCTLHVSGDEYSLGSERELLLFRIVQEAMTNALKHAAPTSIDVYLGYTPAAATVAIADNGIGFDVVSTRSSGIGLSNMHQRAGLLNGALNITSEKDKGTTITLQVANNN